MDLIPSLGRFHMLWSSEEACRPQLLSLCSRARGAATTSPTCHSCRSLSAIELVLHNKKGQGEACTPERESSCRSPRLEKSPHGKEDPAQPKQTIKNFKKSCKLRQTRYGSHIHFSDSVFLRPFAIRKPNYANYCKLPILQSANTRTEMFLKINFTGFLYFPFFWKPVPISTFYFMSPSYFPLPSGVDSYWLQLPPNTLSYGAKPSSEEKKNCSSYANKLLPGLILIRQFFLEPL